MQLLSVLREIIIRMKRTTVVPIALKSLIKVYLKLSLSTVETHNETRNGAPYAHAFLYR